jgi:HK97 family phage major capsid protein
MAITFNKEQNSIHQLMQAIESNDESQMQTAWQGFHDSIAEQVRQDFEAVRDSNDAAVLAQRGFRQLTSKETAWYQRFIDAMKSANPKQAFTSIIGSDQEDALMPETIIEDVYKYLEENHPLLSVIGMRYVGYTTKWVLNDHTAQMAAWGAINSEIAKEITSAFRVIEITQNKLSAFACIQLDMLDLGPTFLDAYIRRCLIEAMAKGLENGVIKGNGLTQPIGLIKDIHEGVSVNSSTGYPDKTKTNVTDFSSETYGALVAALAKTEKGKMRTVGRIALLVNPVDYYKKVVPATTVMGTDGQYRYNVLPVPTQIIQSAELAEGEAVLFLPDEYNLLVGGNRNGLIEYSDEYKFLEDMRYFKIKQHATGRCFDNTSALYLNITNLAPAFVTVKSIDATPTA